MKFDKIGEDRLKITLTYEDMEDMDFDAVELGYENSEASDVLDELLEIAKQKCGFEAKGHRLVIEVMPFHPDGLVLMITKILREDDLLTKMESFKREVQNPLLFFFEDFYTLISALKEIAPLYQGESTVYSFRGNYYLWLLPGETVPQERLILILSEFGKFLRRKSFDGFIKEYATVIIENKAVERALTM